MSRALAECQRLLGQRELSKSDVVNLVSQIRVLLEERNVKAQLPTLNLYCNWTFHTAIDQSMICFRMLEELTDHVLEHKDEPPSSAFFEAITHTIGVRNLQAELIDFCRRLGLQDVLASDPRVWKDFFKLLAVILLDRPIRFPSAGNMKPRVRAIYDSILTKAGGHVFGVKAFSLIVKATEHDPDQKELWWQLDLIVPPGRAPKSAKLQGRFAWVG